MANNLASALSLIVAQRNILHNFGLGYGWTGPRRRDTDLNVMVKMLTGKCFSSKKKYDLEESDATVSRTSIAKEDSSDI